MKGHDRTDRTTAPTRGELHELDWLDEGPGHARPAPTEKTRVLIAEPSRLYAEALMFTLDASLDLEAIGYALNGWDALELTASFEPEAIVVGAGLAGLDTLAFTRLVHLFWPRIRLILLGDTQVPRDVEAAYALGAADYLPKSRSADELLTAIGQACLRQATHERAGRTAALRLAGVSSTPAARQGGLDD
jgi:DNA-binding NarL/FixJ family response regulator